MYSAKIKDGVVVDKALGKGEGYIECSPDVQIGWVYDGSNFTPPTLSSAEQALIRISILEAETSTPRFQRELRNAPTTQYKDTGKTVAEYDNWAYLEIEILRNQL